MENMGIWGKHGNIGKILDLCQTEFGKEYNGKHPQNLVIICINKRPMGHIAHLRKKFKSISTHDYFITLIKRRKKTLLTL